MRRFSIRLLAFVAALALGAIACLGGCSGNRPVAKGRPTNVVVICIDVLRADHVGACGYGRSTTPWIDRLVREGVHFENVTSAASWTKPSVPSYFTGRYPHQHGVYEGSRNEGGRLVSDVLAEEEHTIAEAFADAGYRTGGFVNNAQIDGALGFGQGFDLYADDCGDARDIATRFLDWLDDPSDSGGDADEPFYAYLHFLDVHWPYAPSSPYRELYGPAPTSIDFFTPAWKTLKRNIRDGVLQLGDNDRQAMIDLYDSELRATDVQIGVLLEALRHRGRLEDTMLVFLSDHGEEFLDHGGIGHGNGLYDELLRVPLIVRFPGARHAGTKVDTPATLVDVMPTLLDECRLDPVEEVAGESLLPILAGESLRRRRPIYAEGIHGDRYQQTLIEGRWKYVATLYVGSTDEEGVDDDAPDARDYLYTGVRVEVEGVLTGDGVFLAEEVILQDDQEDDRDKITGTVEALDAENAEIRILGFRAVLADDFELEEDGGGDLDLADLRVGDALKMYGHAESPRLFRAEKAKRRGPSRRKKTKLEGPLRAVTREDRTIVVELSGRSVRIDGGTDVLTAQWERILGERKKRREGKSPASGVSSDPLISAMELGIPIEHRLYDLSVDPLERHDLSRENATRVEAMRGRLDGFRIASSRGRSGRTLDSKDEERLRRMGYIK